MSVEAQRSASGSCRLDVLTGIAAFAWPVRPSGRFGNLLFFLFVAVKEGDGDQGKDIKQESGYEPKQRVSPRVASPESAKGCKHQKEEPWQHIDLESAGLLGPLLQ